MLNQIINGRYEIVEKIAESPFFAVFKGRDRTSNTVVVLKALQPAYAEDDALMQGLQAGFSAAESLNNPSIAASLEQGTEAGRPYFVTEFVRGINLKERIRRIAPFNLSVAIDFACAAAEALHFAHSIGQTHGSLRPQDWIVTPEGQVKITDFGVQRGIARSPKAQREMLLTAAPYHAPELSMTHAGTPAGDIYALGAILYEMLTGIPPYAGDTPDAIADQHAFSDIPSPRIVNPGVPRSIEGIVIKCLQKKPEDRYRSTADLLTDLRSVRDALRFGKPLSWTPIDIETGRLAPARPVAPAPPPPKPAPVPVRPAPLPEPVAAVAASSQVMPMPAENRLRREDDRVSIYIKAALVSVTVLILFALIGLVAVWSSMWAVPPTTPAPELVGRSIEKVREIAKAAKAELREHAEYSEKKKDIVYKTDLEKGATIRANQTINVWFSKGSAWVNVPNITKLTREEAETKLKDLGLAVGSVTTVNSETVLPNYVISQNVSYKKRVQHDTAVGFVVSDGPKIESADPNPGMDNENETSPPGTAPVNPDTARNEHGNPDDGPKTCRKSLKIPRDGRGVRQVRVEFTDARGSQIPIDEPHDEGDSIPIQFDYYGKTVTLVVFYDGDETKRFTFDPQISRRRSLR